MSKEKEAQSSRLLFTEFVRWLQLAVNSRSSEVGSPDVKITSHNHSLHSIPFQGKRLYITVSTEPPDSQRK